MNESFDEREDRKAELREFDSFWSVPEGGGVLPDTKIEEYAEEHDLISPFHPKHLRSAAYELRVGSKYQRSGEIRELDEGESFDIPAYDVAVIQTAEMVNLPPPFDRRSGCESGPGSSGLGMGGWVPNRPRIRGAPPLCCIQPVKRKSISESSRSVWDREFPNSVRNSGLLQSVLRSESGRIEV